MGLKSSFSQLSKGSFKDLLATPKGKGVAAGLVLVVLLLIILVIATMAFPKPSPVSLNPVTQPPVAAQAPAQTTPTASAATDTVEAETETAYEPHDLRDFRDPFSPLIETTNSAGGSTVVQTQTASGSVVSAPQSLSLKDITTQDGNRYALVTYQGNPYEVGVGEQIGTSAFQVTDISDTSVSLIYGDDRLTLQLGDEIIK